MRYFDRHGLKLGLFGLNCSGGLSGTLAPRALGGAWEENLIAAKIADEGAVDALVARRARRGRFDDLPEEMKRNLRQRAGGGNGAYPIVGSPDTVAAKLLTLHGAGIDAFAMRFANYVEHLPYFKDEVLPRLERAGVR